MAGIVKFMTGNRATYEQKYTEGGLEGVIFFSNDDHTIWKDGKLYGQASQGDATWDQIKERYDGAFVRVEENKTNGYTFSFIAVDGTSEQSITIPLANAVTNGVMSSSDFSKLAGIDAANIVYKEEGKGLSSNDYTDSEKQKLAGIQDGAEVNRINQVKVDGTALEISGKAVNIPLTDKINQLVGSKLTSAYEFKGSVATAANLPTTGNKVGDVYNIQTASVYGAAGVNVAWTGNEWDSLGGVFDTTVIDNKIAALESTTSGLSNKVAELEPKVKANTESIRILNSNDQTVGSVAYTATNIANSTVVEYLKWEELN